MIRNKVKIVSNERTSELAFSFKNEREYWEQVSTSNELSRKKYSTAISDGKIKDVLQLILDCFGTGNRSVDVFFEGSQEHFDVIHRFVSEPEFNGRILLEKLETGIAVCGKSASGKTTLIEGLTKELRLSTSKKVVDGYDIYTTPYNRMCFYEIKGIDYQQGTIKNAENILIDLIKKEVSVVLYCINTGKIEDAELDFLTRVKENFPSVNLCIVMTNCVEEKSNLISNQIEDITGITTIPTLARNKKIRNGMEMESFGLSNVTDYIFEGE